MVRPTKCRVVGYLPDSKSFKPAGVPGDKLGSVILNIDELEAVRLADYEGMYFEDAAKKMEISRQTFGNILKSAHQKIADALINGKALKIQGGDVKILKDKEFYCKRCRKQNRGKVGECNSCFK